MKRIASILFICVALSVTVAWAAAPVALPAVENVSIPATVRAAEGRIVLSAGTSDATFGIYSITGQLLRTVRIAAESHTTIEMPKGFYIVRCNGSWSRKVVVK